MSRRIALILLLFFTNPLISNFFMKSWEVEPTLFRDLKKHRYGVLLTGVTSMEKYPADRVHFNKGADRVLHTIELYKKGLIEKVVVTGGSAALLTTTKSESENLEQVLIQAGIPKKDIILEIKARNTAENAIYTRELINPEEKIILITSAFHMRRSVACFRKAGMNVTPFPTDLYSVYYSWTPEGWLVPNINSLNNWDILMKEWMGFTAYKIKGYI
ncbi:MAG: YdcF family protein [Bacteroidota bacterium]